MPLARSSGRSGFSPCTSTHTLFIQYFASPCPTLQCRPRVWLVFILGNLPVISISSVYIPPHFKVVGQGTVAHYFQECLYGSLVGVSPCVSLDVAPIVDLYHPEVYVYAFMGFAVLLPSLPECVVTLYPVTTNKLDVAHITRITLRCQNLLPVPCVLNETLVTFHMPASASGLYTGTNLAFSSSCCFL